MKNEPYTSLGPGCTWSIAYAASAIVGVSAMIWWLFHADVGEIDPMAVPFVTFLCGLLGFIFGIAVCGIVQFGAWVYGLVNAKGTELDSQK